MDADWTLGGAEALSLHAPAAAAALSEVVRSRPEDLDEGAFSAIRVATAGALGLVALAGSRRPAQVPPPAVVAFAEQFAVDVSLVDDELRADWSEAVGDARFSAVQMVYVADFVPRLRAALDALFGPDEWWDPPQAVTHDSWLAIDTFMREVARLEALDPVLTELVRLRGARQHECRVCKSRRSLAAIEAGAGAATFQAVDTHRTSGLPPATKAALALTDAMIWTPGRLRADEVAAVRAHLSPAQAVEVVLDVTRNAANKIAVALAADAPVVESGVELFETDADGNLAFP
jgi:alkylhydroperoxidase family enzyme